MEIKNAKIERTMLGYEDHGILTFMLFLDYGGSGQGFGGYQLSVNASNIIERILNTVGVKRWEDLEGEHIRVKATHDNVHSIGNLLEDKWFTPSEELKF